MRDFSFTKDDDVIIDVVVLLELFDPVSRMQQKIFSMK